MSANVAQPVIESIDTALHPQHPLHAMTTYELRDYCCQMKWPSGASTRRTPCPRYGVSCKPGSMKR